MNIYFIGRLSGMFSHAVENSAPVTGLRAWRTAVRARRHATRSLFYSAAWNADAV